MTMRKIDLSQVGLMVLMALLIVCYSIPMTVYGADTCTDGGEHDDVVTIEKRATQSKSGTRRYTCQKCGRTYTETIPSMGHKWGKWKTVKKATCTTKGKKKRTCVKHAELNHTQTKTIAATGHDWSGWKTVKKPALGKAGLAKKVCKNNSEEVKYKILPAKTNPASGSGGGTAFDEGKGGANGFHNGGAEDNGSGIDGTGTDGGITDGSNTSGDSSNDADDTNSANRSGNYGNSGSNGSNGDNGGNGGNAAGGNGGAGTGDGDVVPFGAADAAILGANGVALFFWIILLLPLVRVMFWIIAKRREKEEEEESL